MPLPTQQRRARDGCRDPRRELGLGDETGEEAGREFRGVDRAGGELRPVDRTGHQVAAAERLKAQVAGDGAGVTHEVVVVRLTRDGAQCHVARRRARSGDALAPDGPELDVDYCGIARVRSANDGVVPEVEAATESLTISLLPTDCWARS